MQVVFGGGCFWCIEAAYKELVGVNEVVPGYAGGDTPSPSYRQVCSGRTGHAEVVRVSYDEQVVSFGTLLEVFFRLHDPTQVDRQGADVGSQYRSVILYTTEKQRESAKQHIQELAGSYDEPIATQLAPLEEFFVAEEEHHDYFEKHPSDAYCVYHAAPKVRLVREEFSVKDA